MAWAIFFLAVASASASAEASTRLNEPLCQLESDTSHRITTPPRNASDLRTVAVRSLSHGFGPFLVWDLDNEFWYRETNGDLVLYCNTNDNYMYYWRFRSSGGKLRLSRHGLINCGGDE